MKKTLLILMISCLCSVGYSQTFTVDNITYQVTSATSNTVRVSFYNAGVDSNITIPSTITNPATSITYDVTSIANSAFENKGVQSVVIPNSIISVGNNAFKDNQLTSVIIPDSVINLGGGAFQSNDLTSITISNNLTIINPSTFLHNEITSVVIPNNVISIGAMAFFNNQLTSVVIGDNVQTIGDYAFRINQLTNVTIPNNVTSIGVKAFSDNNSLTSVVSQNTTPPTITTGGINDTFGNRSGVSLSIPSGTMGAYVTDPGALWTGFNTVTEDALLSVLNVELASNIRIVLTPQDIKVNHPNTITLKSYTIYTIEGTKIATGINNTFSKSFLPSGIYILNLSFDKGIVCKKILISK